MGARDGQDFVRRTKPRMNRFVPSGLTWERPAAAGLLERVMIYRRAIFAALVACSAWPCAAAAQWASFADSRGTSVQYPREIFTAPAGEGVPPGPVLQSADGGARLHVFTLANEGRASPAEFIRRVAPEQGEHLSYRRVSNRFLVFSDARGDLILYRRCNFIGRAIHCFDVRYPRGEKRAWDERVTRMSFSLRPR